MQKIHRFLCYENESLRGNEMVYDVVSEAINKRSKGMEKTSGHRNFSDTLITPDTLAENPRWPNPTPHR